MIIRYTNVRIFGRQHLCTCCAKEIIVAEDTLVIVNPVPQKGRWICIPCVLEHYPAEYSAFIARKLTT